ncbi:MAG: hypothetical protein ACW99G_22860 [Candidatus Thorarchaeota archaeon]
MHDISIHIPIEWEYYPGSPATYHDPEEHETVEFFSVTVPDELEVRKEEIEWVVDDQLGELQEEALEHIHDSFKRMEVVGNEYA